MTLDEWVILLDLGAITLIVAYIFIVSNYNLYYLKVSSTQVILLKILEIILIILSISCFIQLHR